MSCAAIDRVRRMQGIPSHIKHFLSCVAFYVDETHTAEIYIGRLSDDIGVGERQVQKLQQKAADLGLVTLTPTGHKGRNIYTLRFPDLEFENAETRTLVRDTPAPQPEPEFGEAGAISNSNSGSFEKPEPEVALSRTESVVPRTTVRVSENPNSSSPLLDSDSDSDSPSKDSLRVKSNESESITKSVKIDNLLTGEGVKIYDWLTDKAEINDPPCTELTLLAVEEGVDLNIVMLAFMYAKRKHLHHEIDSPQGWIVNAVRESGWRTVAEYANKKTHPNTAASSPFPSGNNAKKQPSKMARFQAILAP